MKPASDGPCLLVIDRCDPQVLRDAARSNERDWLVLPLVIGEAALRARCGDELSALGAFRVADVGSMADEAHERVRAFVVDYLANVQERPGQGSTLAQTLSDRGETLWWYLEVSERSSFRQPLIQQLYQLAMIQLVLERHSCSALAIALQDGSLSHVLLQGTGALRVHLLGPASAADSGSDWTLADTALYWRRAVMAVARAAALRLISVLLRASVPKSEPSANAFFTFFPISWWLTPFGPNPTNRFFSALPNDGYFAAWLESPVELLRRLAEVKRTMVLKRIVPLQSFSAFADAGPVVSPARYRRTRAAMRQAQRLSARFGNFEVGPLVARAIRGSLTGGEAPEDLLIAPAVARFIDARRPRALVFRSEFQPSEQPLLRACAGRATAIGFLHHPFGRYFLPMQFDPEQMSRLRSTRSGMARPMPNGYLATGLAGKRHLTDVGVPARAIATCGPQRFHQLLEYRRKREPREVIRTRLGLPAGLSVFFVATAVLEADNESLLAAVVDSCRTLPAYRLIIKPHPNFPDGDAAIKRALADLGPDRAALLEASIGMYDAMAAADSVISTGSTIVFEAMALDVMPIAFENPGTFAASTVREFAAGLYATRSVDELRRAIEDVISGGAEIEKRRREWPRLIAEGLGDLESPLTEQLATALTALAAAPSEASSS